MRTHGLDTCVDVKCFARNIFLEEASDKISRKRSCPILKIIVKRKIVFSVDFYLRRTELELGQSIGFFCYVLVILSDFRIP